MKRFKVEGFGEVGEANLLWFIPNKGEKPYQDLQPFESTCGYAKADFIRVVRLEDTQVETAGINGVTSKI